MACSFLACLLACFAGCTPAPDSSDESAATPKQVEITLRVAIEDDPELERAIQRLRGEWQEHSGGTIKTSLFVVDQTGESLFEAAQEADLILFASRRLGELCERHAIRPLRPSVIKNETLRFDDFLPLVRNEEIVYGKQAMALPVGCPTPLLAKQAEAELLQIRLPIDFSETINQAETIELAITYLAWAAPHVVHKGSEANLFDPGLGNGSLVARIAEPPFVRALERLQAAVNFEGEPNSTVVWPRRGSEPDREKSSTTYAEVLPLGIADENYNRMAEAWEPLSERDRHATLLASSGRLIAVTSSSRNAATAFRYAAWLVSPSNSRLLSTASNQVANARGSNAREADDWLPGGNSSLGQGIARTLAKSLRETRYMTLPRLPGSDRYLLSLGKAVRITLNGESSAGDALNQCSNEWDAISDDLGLSDQRAAYLRSIGSADYHHDASGSSR